MNVASLPVQETANLILANRDNSTVTERPKPNPSPDSKGGGRMFATFALFTLFAFAASRVRKRTKKEKRFHR
jgi:hypothetical protein